MKVRDLMITKAISCAPETNLGAAVELLWKYNCGFLPVVDAEGKVTGVLTDRDICIALGTRNQLPGQIKVGDVAASNVYCCKAADDVGSALHTMAHAKVRRLPVVDAGGKLEGILSMDDVIVHIRATLAEPADGPSSAEVVETLKKVYGTKLPVVIGRSSYVQ